MAGDGLQALMIQPVQRITRYRLLIQQIIKLSPGDHADNQALRKALEEVSQVAAVRRWEGAEWRRRRPDAQVNACR